MSRNKRSIIKAYSICIGARHTRGGGKRFHPADQRLIEAITQKHFPAGFTITNAKGGWFDAALGKLVKEESRQIIVGGGEGRKIARWCRDLAIALNQREIVAVKLGTMSVYRISPAARSAAGRRRA